MDGFEQNSSDLYPKLKIESFALLGGINAKSSPYINGPTEFRDLSNVNFLYPGSLTKRPGSTMYVGPTLSGSILGGTEFQRLDGSSFIVIAANTNLYSVAPPTTINVVVTNLTSGKVFNYVTFVDRLFCTNGTEFFKFDGTNNYLFSLPPGMSAAFGVTAVVGGSLTPGVTQTFVAAYGYVNERGYAGPIGNGLTLVLNGVTFNSIGYYGMTYLSGYGITAIQLWRTGPNSVDFYGTTTVALGTATATDTGFPLGSSLALPHLWFTMVPRFQAVYNNQYFMAGFSSMPSRVYWSEIGEPEAVQPTYWAEFRTNDGDNITGLKVYNGALVVSKQRSLHRIVGDNPSNFSLQEISLEYGCLSNRAMVTFENNLWMLDQKGLVSYNGANVEIVTTKPEPVFLSMNVGAAVDRALAIHYKQYNEVWVAFPGRGSSVNNQVLVYDYVADAWTRYDGIRACDMFLAQATQPAKTVFFGGYTGALFYVGSSFMGDNGSAMTCVIKSRFIAPTGQTTENMYRRFWMDIDPIVGVTQSIDLNFYKNYSTSTVSYSKTIQFSNFQNRIDFGLNARSIAVTIQTSSATLPFKLNAFTFASRFLRNV